MVVDPDVISYSVIDPYVFGERRDAEIDKSLSNNYGHFILDMRSGKLLEALDEAAFQVALKRIGVQ
jgi:hypothetical protein